MARTGLLLNRLIAILLTLYTYSTLPAFLGADPAVFPEWAQNLETGTK